MDKAITFIEEIKKKDYTVKTFRINHYDVQFKICSDSVNASAFHNEFSTDYTPDIFFEQDNNWKNIIGVKINWGAYGSKSIEETKKFIDEINQSIQTAQIITENIEAMKNYKEENNG